MHWMIYFTVVYKSIFEDASYLSDLELIFLNPKDLSESLLGLG